MQFRFDSSDSFRGRWEILPEGQSEKRGSRRKSGKKGYHHGCSNDGILNEGENINGEDYIEMRSK